MEMPEVETLDEELPMTEQPAMETLPLTTTTTHRAEAGPPKVVPSTAIRSHLSVSLQTFEDLQARIDIPESVPEEEPCAALDRILDLELSQVLQTERGTAQTAPLTRTDIEMSLLPLLNTTPTDLGYTTGLERDVEMADAEMDDLLRFAVDLLDQSWTGFVDFEGNYGI
jgi:hypothetical protein